MNDFFDVIILAAGESKRMGTNKMLLQIGTETVLSRTVKAFYAHPLLRKIILVMGTSEQDIASSIIATLDKSKFTLAIGGDSRTQSVENGLAFASAPITLIHDGARPFVSLPLIDRVLNGVKEKGSAIPALPVTDSIRKMQGDKIVGEVNREEFFTVQTPQGFNTEKIKLAYSKRKGEVYTDDSGIYLRYIAPPHMVKGEERNIKITNLGTYYGLNSNIGTGYDIHNLVPFRKLILGGIEIPYEKGLMAHSDGDAVIHALIDALLSAIGERDIGYHFPDTSAKYLDIDSAIMLSEVMDIYHRQNQKINNISIIIIADEPKLSDYIPLMRVKLAPILGIDKTQIAISAKTSEGNQNSTISAYCTVIVN